MEALTLNPLELRVLGSLIEKQLATPDHYPLSLNSLTAACNQTSNRDPVMVLDEADVSAAVAGLRRIDLARSFQGSGSRVPKFQHLLVEREQLTTVELATLCVLMLRGPQTLAEVKSRAARLLQEDGVAQIEQALEALMSRTPAPAVVRLMRRPGQKEVRYAHLLGGEVTYDRDDEPAPVSPRAVDGDRIAALEELTAELRNEMTDLRAQFLAFRKQFE